MLFKINFNSDEYLLFKMTLTLTYINKYTHTFSFNNTFYLKIRTYRGIVNKESSISSNLYTVIEFNLLAILNPNYVRQWVTFHQTIQNDSFLHLYSFNI